MPLSLRCPNPACAKTLSAPDELAGRSVKCPQCGQAFAARPTLDDKASGTHPAPLRPADPSPAVATVGRFRVRAKLGEGAFGSVYRAYDPQLDREVAVKVPHPGVMADPKRVERFLREAKAAAQLRHPHIVPVFDAGKDGDTLYIASAFIHGKPLSETIDEKGTDLRRAARVVRELAEALGYAHDQGIVHRDVKPENVLVDEQDRVHLMDFGLAARQDDAAKLTNDGAVMGTPSYMAPEQAAGRSAETGPAADQYACGVVLYELLTGRVPFEGPAAIVIHNAIHTPPDSPRKLRPDVTKDLEVICLKSLAKRPEDRFPDCQAMADDLRRWLDGEPIVARRLSLRERTVRWAMRNRGVAVALLLIAGSLTVGASVATWFAVEAELARRTAKAEQVKAEKAQQDAEEARHRAEQAQQNEADSASAALTQAARADAEAKKATENLKEKETALQKVIEAQSQAAKDRATAETAGTRAQQAEQGKLLAEQRSEAYAIGRPQLYNHIQRQIESRHTEGIQGALASVPVEKRGWEWHYLYVHGKTPGYRDINLLDAKADHYLHYMGRMLVSCNSSTKSIWIADLANDRYRVSPYPLALPKRNIRNPLYEYHRDIGLHIQSPFAIYGVTEFSITLASISANHEIISSKERNKQMGLLSTADSDIVVGNENCTYLMGFSLTQQRESLWTGFCSIYKMDDIFLPTKPAKVHEFELNRFFPPLSMPEKKWGRAVARLSFNGEYLFYAGKVFSLVPGQSPRVLQDIPSSNTEPTHIKFSQSGKYLAVVFRCNESELRNVRIYTIGPEAASRQPFELRGHTGDVRSIAFIPGDMRLVTGSDDGTVKIWDTQSQECLLTLVGPGGSVKLLAVSADGLKVTAVGEARVRIWEVRESKKLPRN